MNTFGTMEGILGDTKAKCLDRSFHEFLEQARLIRDGLGKQSYLFDRYLSLLLEAANTELAYDAASHGFDGVSPLMRICVEILSGKPKGTENPIYDVMAPYIASNPLPYQEIVTKRAVCCAMLSGAMLEQAATLFSEELNDRFRTVVDIVELCDLYRAVCSILGGEEEMEKLNLLFRQRFLVATPMAMFEQGATNQLIYSLLYRDRETSRQVFQLILDNPAHAVSELQD